MKKKPSTMNIASPFPGTIQRSARRGTPFILTDEQAEWLYRCFPVTPDHTLAKMIGVGYMTVRRMAAKLGLAKDKAAYSERSQRVIHQIAESERRRARLCLPSRTRWRLPSKPYTPLQLRKRYQAVHKYGYVLADDCSEGGGHRFVIYYDQETRRNKTFEEYSKIHGFRFKEWTDS